MAGQPVTYGSPGRPTPRPRSSELVVHGVRGRRVHPLRPDQLPRVRLGQHHREQPVRGHPQPVGHRVHPGRLEWRGRRRGGARACSRRPTPATAVARSGSRRRAADWSGTSPAAAGWPTACPGWSGLSVEGVVTRTVADSAAILEVISGPDPLAWWSPPGQGAAVHRGGRGRPGPSADRRQHGVGPGRRGRPRVPGRRRPRRRAARVARPPRSCTSTPTCSIRPNSATSST